MNLRSNKIVLALVVVAALFVAGVRLTWQWIVHPMRRAARAYAEGRWTSAVQAGLEHLNTYPKSTDARLLVARSYMQLEEWDEAEQQFSQVDDLDLDDARSHARALAKLGRLQESAAIYQSLHEQWPDNPLCLQELAATLLELRKLNDAIRLCERLADFTDHGRAAHFLLGTAYFQKSEYATAATHFEWLLADDPELNDPVTRQPVFWQIYGKTLIRLGRMEEAEVHLNRAVVLHRSADILGLLAEVFEARGEPLKAEQRLLQAIELDPENVTVLRSLALLALRGDRPEQSADYLRRALEIAPNEAKLHADLAVAYERAGLHAEATAHSERADRLRQLEGLRDYVASQVRGGQDSPEARLLVVIADLEEDRVKQAETRLRDILRDDPACTLAQQLLEALSQSQ